jgi:putative redox protein
MITGAKVINGMTNEITSNKMRVQLRQISATTSEATMGRHRVLVDRPIEKNGTDLGPMGGQLFLASIGGCFMSNLLAAIKARGSEISNVQTEVTGTVPTDAPARFTSVELLVTADGDREGLEKIVEIAQRACIMVNTLRGVLELTVRIGVPV